MEVRAGRERPARTGAEVDPPRRVPQRAWKPRDVKAVRDVRRKYPFMGKARIRAVLARKGRELSVSTVGRIIERALKAGAIRPASFLRRAPEAQAAAPSSLSD